MRENYNKQVFESMPDSAWLGKMPELPDSQNNRKTIFRIVGKVAVYAAAAMAIPLAIAVFHNKDVPASAAPIAEASIEYTVNPSLRGDVILPDSTHVILNSGSSLRLSEDFGTGTRTVYLDGEGFFDVHKDKNVPFLIRTPQDIVVKVTGTKFSLQCFSGSPKFDLTLIQGAVQVTTPTRETIEVKPSEQLVIADGVQTLRGSSEPEESLAWTKGILRFSNTPMREAITQIERWYGVNVVVADDAVYKNSITAEFRSETLTEVLDLLCITSRLSYKSDGATITLNKK